MVDDIVGAGGNSGAQPQHADHPHDTHDPYEAHELGEEEGGLAAAVVQPSDT